MSRKIDTKKQVFNKTEYEKTIDTRFNDLGTTGIKDAIKETVSTEEFFQLYGDISNFMLKENDLKNLFDEAIETIDADKRLKVNMDNHNELEAIFDGNLNKDIQLAEIESGQKFNVTASISE